MAKCRRCGIEVEAAQDLEHDLCEGCIEDFLDEDDADEELACADDTYLSTLDWIDYEVN